MEQFGLLCLLFGGAVIVFIVCRELLCWYWKINQHISNQAKQIELLEKAIQQITENQRRSISLLQNIERGIKEFNNQSTQS
jgi:uncharacterized membrane protein YciS (DUF1049 family)